MKKIAIVTGATGGLGKEFIKQLLNEELDEIWAIGRNEEKLAEIKNLYGDIIKIISCDLSKDVQRINDIFEDEKPNIKYLINNAGIAMFGPIVNASEREINNLIDINCKVPTLLCQYALPYMFEGAKILNISSASSFQPNPYIALYSASKVYLRSYTRSLNYELKERKITATAVCPGWIKTDMLKTDYNGKYVKFPGIVTPDKVVKKALKDAKRGKDMSVCTLFVKFEHLLSKIYPQKLCVKVWGRSVKKYVK